ncbi:MAG: hypothetical protein CMK25_04170 [Porticoccaceae bacterium]|nr:hypothetical protein [Porticoccaceae bacterium]MDG2115707.1 TonB-dependent receptor [Porticoccaceae bacterium]
MLLLNKAKKLIGIPVIIVGCITTANVSLAQDEVGIEEIVVTAQKRASTLQETSLAMSAVTADTLTKSGVVDTYGLADLSPNLLIGQENSETVITIRGISAQSMNSVGEPSAAFHQDGVYISRPTAANTALFDVERTEILRGPQGTLYGRAATSGAVNVITKKPTSEFEGSVGIEVGNYNAIKTRGVLSGPLSDTVSGRLSFFTNEHDGYLENVSPLAPPGPDNDDADDVALRAQLLFNPSDDLEILVAANYYERGGAGDAYSHFGDFPGTNGNGGSPFFERRFGPLYVGATPNPHDPRKIATNLRSQLDREDYGLAVTVTRNFDDFDLVAQFARQEYNLSQLKDLDGSDNNFSQIDFQFYTDADTAEIRLVSTDDGPLDWVTGAFYFKEKNSNIFDVCGTTLGCRYGDSHGGLESTALFGQVSYDLSDSLEVVAGLRYTDDKRTGGNVVPVTFVFLTPGEMIKGSSSGSKTTWKLGLNRTDDNGNLLYASVSSGYKAGSFNLRDNTTYGPENVIEYAVGSKNTLLDNRLQLNATAFFYDYEDMHLEQVVGIDGNISILTINATDSEVKGIELEAIYLASDALQLSGQISFLDTEFLALTDTDSLKGFAAQPEDLTGNTFARAPETSITLAAEYTFNLASGGTLAPRLQYRYQDEWYLRHFNTADDLVPSHNKTDFTLTYSHPNDKLSVMGYVYNIANNDILSGENIGLGGYGSPRYGHWKAPRLFGVRLDYKID